MSTNAPRSPKCDITEGTKKGGLNNRPSSDRPSNPPPPPPSETILGSINFNHSCNCSGKCFDPKLLGVNIFEQNGLITVELKYDENIVSKDSLQICSGRF